MIIPDRIQCPRCHAIRPYSLTGLCQNCGFPGYTYVTDHATAVLGGQGSVSIETSIIEGVFAEARLRGQSGLTIEVQIIDSAMAQAQQIIEIVRGCTQGCQQPWIGDDTCACRNIVRRVRDALARKTSR